MNILVTGATRGIGKAICENLDGDIYACGRNEGLLKSYENYCVCDLTVNCDIEKLGNYIAENKIDVLINNAGISISGPINELDSHDSDRIFDVNLKGVYNCCKSAVNQMVEQKSGRIINISSMWGQVGASCEVAYSAAKAGVIGLTKALAKELAPSGITVNAIAPGLIDTSMNSGLTVEEIDEFVSNVPLGRIGTPDDIAAAALFLASDDADYITGQVLGVNGGYVI